MSRRFECRQPGFVRRIAIGGDGDKRAIVPIFVRAAERLVDHGQGAFAVLAGALGHELLDPEAERRERGRERQRQLVASLEHGGADERAQGEPGIGVVLLPAAVRHGRAGRVELGGIRADERRGHESEERQRRKPPADVGWVHEYVAVALGLGECLERRARDR